MKTPERIEGAPRSFRIRAENVPVQGIEINETLTQKFVDSLLLEPKEQVSWRVLGDTPFSCKIEHEADMLHLKGGGTFTVVHPCVRCMEDVEMDIPIVFNSRLLPSDQDPDQGLEFDQETFDDAVAQALEDGFENVASYYEDGIIDLSELLREQLFLEFPLYPCCDGPEAKSPKACDQAALDALNMAQATIIEHPFAGLKDFNRLRN